MESGSGGVAFSGGELTIIASLLVCLAGAISALWFAYSKAMQAQLDQLIKDRDRIQATAFEAIGLLAAIGRAGGAATVTAEQRQAIAALQARLVAPPAPAP